MENTNQYQRSLSLTDGALLVIGSMIGSGIFIVSADVARTLGSAGWLIVSWLIAGAITLIAALSYGELSGMYPKAGGQYVYLREAYGKLYGFLYGWAFFAVIQTGTIAAVGVGFAKFLGYLLPSLGETNVLTTIGDFQLKASQLTGIFIILLLTFINSKGVKNVKWIQFIFTFAKIAAMAALIFFGFFVVKNTVVWHQNWATAWQAQSLIKSPTDGSFITTLISGKTLLIAICMTMTGTLFSSDAWNNVTFIAGEIKKPEKNIARSLLIGTLVVTCLYILINLMYLFVLPINEIAAAPNDRVALAAALKILGSGGTAFIAILVMISTFGCNNGLILSGARVYNTMANDGLFIPAAKKINKYGVPATALWMQGIWASILCLTGKYGQLLDFIMMTVLLFYILTIGGIFILRKKHPEMPRPYKVWAYPFLPALYIIAASTICIVLLIYKFDTTWQGIVITLIGIPIYYYFEKKYKLLSE